VGQAAQIIPFPRRSDPMGNTPMVSKKQLARFFDAGTSTVDRWCREGMPWHPVGGRRRFRVSECESWHAQRFRV
jgi:phage terminase Nu1 subunit (DNA packaging protein)